MEVELSWWSSHLEIRHWGNQEVWGRICDMFHRKMGCEVNETSSFLKRWVLI
jgi:hypothetical protein